MSEVKAQGVRRALINIVSSYDVCTVNKEALEDSTQFKEFLDKEIITGAIDSLDYIDIIMELEDALGVDLDDTTFTTWHQLFDKLVLLCYQGES